MDLGDGMTMKVPLPKKTTTSSKPKPKPKPKKTLDTSKLNIHEIKSERLAIGDAIIATTANNPVVIFERKTLADLAASIRDGRYKEQSFRLLETAAATGFAPHNIVYIIEGDIARYDERHTQITKTALQSAMVSLMYYKGFSVFRTMNVGETADFILHFADKLAKDGAAPVTQEDTYSEVAAKKEKRDYITRENIGEIMLSQVPGVSPKVAAAILSKYGGSIYEFLVDLRRKIDDYEESLSPEISPPPVSVPVSVSVPAPMNKNKLKHVSACFSDISTATATATDGKRGIGKATIEKLCYFLS
jgi:ERCC4-type nuclease